MGRPASRRHRRDAGVRGAAARPPGGGARCRRLPVSRARSQRTAGGSGRAAARRRRCSRTAADRRRASPTSGSSTPDSRQMPYLLERRDEPLVDLDLTITPGRDGARSRCVPRADGQRSVYCAARCRIRNLPPRGSCSRRPRACSSATVQVGVERPPDRRRRDDMVRGAGVGRVAARRRANAAPPLTLPIDGRRGHGAAGRRRRRGQRAAADHGGAAAAAVVSAAVLHSRAAPLRLVYGSDDSRRRNTIWRCSRRGDGRNEAREITAAPCSRRPRAGPRAALAADVLDRPWRRRRRPARADRQARETSSRPRFLLGRAPSATCSMHAQQVAAPDLADLLLGVAAAHQLQRDVERLARVVPAVDAAAAVEVRRDADVIDADLLDDVVDVIDEVLDRGARRRRTGWRLSCVEAAFCSSLRERARRVNCAQRRRHAPLAVHHGPPRPPERRARAAARTPCAARPAPSSAPASAVSLT